MKFKEGDIIYIMDGVGGPRYSIYIVQDVEDVENYWLHPLFMTPVVGKERVHIEYIDKNSVKLTMEEVDFARLLFK